jgi:hypothetical protein
MNKFDLINAIGQVLATQDHAPLNVAQSAAIATELANEDFMIGLLRESLWINVDDGLPVIPPQMYGIKVLWQDEEGEVTTGLFSDDEFLSLHYPGNEAKFMPAAIKPIRWRYQPVPL